MSRRFLLLGLMCFCCFGSLSAQLYINELSSQGGITDFNGKSSDWIELYNAGDAAINLEGYWLTDDANAPDKWSFPSLSIPAKSHTVVLANGEDIAEISNYVVYAKPENEWQYHIGNDAPPSDWNEIASSATDWPTAQGGFGYADGDDGTNIPSGTRSVFMRKEFNLEDLSSLQWMYFFMDYDDGFIAYINGSEIARSSNMFGHNGNYNVFSSGDHEAVLYSGGIPEDFVYDYESLLVEGKNVLAVQVHNTSSTSSDLSANPFLFASVDIGSINAASDTDLPDWFFTPTSYLQTNFKLSKEGETIQLRDNSGALVDEFAFPFMKRNHSYGREIDGDSNWCLHLNPTPEESNELNNTACYDNYAAKPILSPDPGFYENGVAVGLECPDDNAVAHYSDDGSIADQSGTVANALSLFETKVLSVKCYSEGKAPSDNSTGTYFIDEPEYDLPVVSISVAPDDLWDDDYGIYVLGDTYENDYPYMGANFWQPWERDSNFEFFELSGERVVDIGAALEIHGGWSRAEPQKSFRIDTKKSIDGYVEYPLFSRKPDIGVFNNFNVRNTGQVNYSNRFQDAFLSELVSKHTAIDYMTHESTMVYLNGDFWGHYALREKMDEHYIESNHGVSANNVDLLSRESALTGTNTHFLETVDIAMGMNVDEDAFYPTMAERIDMDNYIDYYATEIHIQNKDWGGIGWALNNTKLWRPQTEDGKWRFMLYDMDGALGNFGDGINNNYINRARNPVAPSNISRLFNRLLQNPTFKNKFINRYADLINTIFQPAFYNLVIDEIKDELEADMPRQIARWGLPSNMSNWYGGIANMRNHLQGRESTSRTHIRSSFDLESSRFISVEVEPSGAGRIQVNSITPESFPWNGIYFQGVPITVTAIPNPGYTFDSWDDNDLLTNLDWKSNTLDPTMNSTFRANFSGAAESPGVVISEINYNSLEDRDTGDWIELYNPSSVPLDISNWTFEDEQFYNLFKVPLGTVIEPEAFIVLTADIEKFENVHQGLEINALGDFDFQLSNGGERIGIRNHNGDLINEVTYSDQEPWATEADGEGFTLELFDLSADGGEAGSWVAQCFLGSPGRAFTNACISDIESIERSSLLNVYPNPASNKIYVSMPAIPAQEYVLALQDGLGRMHNLGKRRLETGSSIELPKIPDGVYILSLVSEEQSLQQKLIIQH